MSDTPTPVDTANLATEEKVTIHVPIYTVPFIWDAEDSLINRIDWTYKRSGTPDSERDGPTTVDGRAIIHLPAEISDAQKQKLASLQVQLREGGYDVYANVLQNGEYVLEVGGLRHQAQDKPHEKALGKIFDDRSFMALVDILQAQDIVRGDATKGEAERDTVETTVTKVNLPGTIGSVMSMVDRINNWLDERTPFNASERLKLAGWVGNAGHAALIGAGITENDQDRVRTGLLYGSSATLQAIYGNGANLIDHQALEEDVIDHLQSQGYSMPRDEITLINDQLGATRNPLRSAEQFVASHPIQVAQASGTTGNVSMMLSGLREEGFANKIGRFAHGFAGLIGGLAVMFLPEKKPPTDPHEIQEKLEREQHMSAPRRVAQRVFDFIQFSPFFFSASLQLLDNAAMIYDVFRIKIKRDQILNGYEHKPSVIDHIKGFFGGEKPEKAWVPPVREQIETKLAEYNAFLADEGIRPVSSAGLGTVEGLQFEGLPEANGLREEIQELELKLFRAENMGKWSPVLAAVTAASYTLSTVITLFSSKNPDTSYTTPDAYEPLFARLAGRVAQLPDEHQMGVINKMAEFLSERDDIKAGGLDATRIAIAIGKKVTAMENHPTLPSIDAQELARTMERNGGFSPEKWDVTIHTAPMPEATPPHADNTDTLVQLGQYKLSRSAPQQVPAATVAADARTLSDYYAGLEASLNLN